MGGLVFPATAGGAWAFVVITLGIGGAAAWASGRALARTWQTPLLVPVYAVLIGIATRFLHFVLAREALLSWHYLIADCMVAVVVAAIAYRRTRAHQMTTQYGFLSAPPGQGDRT